MTLQEITLKRRITERIPALTWNREQAEYMNDQEVRNGLIFIAEAVRDISEWITGPQRAELSGSEEEIALNSKPAPRFKIPSRVGMMDIEMERAVVCHCGQRYIDPNSRQHWYYSTHSEKECFLELPDKMCSCGLLRSEHIDGHRPDPPLADSAQTTEPHKE